MKVNPLSLSCIIFDLLVENAPSRLDQILLYNNRYPDLPVLVIIDKDNIELARLCGAHGIKNVIGSSTLDEIPRELARIINDNQVKASLRELNVELSACSFALTEILLYIESYYQKIMTVQEIAQRFNYSEFNLIKDFKKSGLISPKKMLLCLKIIHAIKLMDKTSYKMKEIATLSGFSNEKRFNECFNRVLGCSPKVYHLNMHATNVNHG
ncbi:helix-turn-helix transcriptional regulator [Chitinophaga sp. 22321]